MSSRFGGTSVTAWAAAAGLVVVLGTHPAGAQSTPGAENPVRETMSALQPYAGVYRLGPDHRLGIDRFISDSGDSTLLFCDYQTGLVRPLFRVSATEFAMGPGFAVRSPVELTVQFEMDAQGVARSLTMRPAGGPATVARREPSRDEEVVFRHGDISLAGTLITPATPGPHPAVVLLHGSGPLTRHSFGPWPRFFNSLGMAVLVFDKRGTGASNGVRLDASTGAPSTLSPRYYPDDLADDALAALRYLQGRTEIDREQIGFWGSSEGGMLATQVAARSRDVAFAIDSSGFMGPLWETLLYQAGALAKGRGAPALEVDETMAFTRLWMEVARTGQGYDDFLKRREAIIASGRSSLLSYESAAFTSLEQMRWVWTHILAFSPLPALRQVTAPVLGVWGEADPLTDAPRAATAMREALAKGGNKDVTVKIFPGAGHSLMETPSRKGMAPGVFAFLRQWLTARVKPSPAGRAEPQKRG
jgi:pimeloyl-ACP methyl ester carboxylesterase